MPLKHKRRCITMSDRQYDMLQEEAGELQLSVSETVRRILDGHFATKRPDRGTVTLVGQVPLTGIARIISEEPPHGQEPR